MVTLRYLLFWMTLSFSAAAQSMPTAPAGLTEKERMQETNLTEEEMKIPAPQPGDERLKLTMKTPTVQEGAVIDMILITTNQSGHPIREERVRGANCGQVIEKGIRIRDAAGNPVTLKKEEEKPLVQPPDYPRHFVERAPCMGSSFGYSKIVSPGRSIWEPWHIAAAENSLSPGTYKLQVYYGADFKHATARSNTLTIRVVPTTGAEQ